MDKTMNRTNTFSKLLIVIGAVLVFLYAFTVNHVDCNTITTWGYDLLESIRHGSFRDYPTFTYEAHNMATNYSLVSNMINAIWLLPVYIIDTLLN